jgi:hypothetical protein
MRKSILPRVGVLLVVYIVVFSGLIVLQFFRRSSFTEQVGAMVISGFYDNRELEASSPGSSVPLSGNCKVVFGSMEFRLSALGLQHDGSGIELSPAEMEISTDTVLFRFPGDTELRFMTVSGLDGAELRITSRLGDDLDSLEIVCRPTVSSFTAGDDNITVNTPDGSYTFVNSVYNGETRKLILGRANLAANYKMVPAEESFDPASYILAEAAAEGAYAAAFDEWRDRFYSSWARAGTPSENTLIAYLSESIRLSLYQRTVSSVTNAVRSRMTYRSYAYLGRIADARSSITLEDRNFLGRVSRLISEKSPALLSEPRVFYNLFVRGDAGAMDSAAELVRTLGEAEYDFVPGIFEGWVDWHNTRPGDENPFDGLIQQGWSLIAENIRKAGSGVFVVKDNEADMRYNIRLGRGLDLYGREAGRNEMAALGRSIILSVLSLAEDEIPGVVTFNEDFSIQGASGSSIESAEAFIALSQSAYLPRAESISGLSGNVWAWTAANSFSAQDDAEALTIAVGFPAGESHYLIVKNIPSFRSIQIYNLNYPSDPNFETYDSAGWRYFADEQILLIKMKHKESTEYIRIFH